MDTIFLCDLTHRSRGVCSEMVPYPIGCIKSYFHEFSTTPADVLLFKYAENVSDAFFQRRPSIVGFSNYMWNLDLSCTIAAAIKALAPETLIIFGGPNYPLEAHRQEAWLRDHPMVDVYIVGEGEQPFTQAADLWMTTRSIDAVKRSAIYGLHALVDGKLHKTTTARHNDGFDDSPRIADLNRTPSPYLKGYLDEFLNDPALVPLMECNRGCPFSCTFCVDGIGARSKVNKVSVQRLEAELTYIAQRHTGKYLFIADTNFGMYPEDVEFCKIMAEVKERYHFPLYLQVSTGKNQKARAIECAELLKGSLRFSAAVQSLDQEVLSNIKRSNISYEQLIDAASQVAQIDGNTYSDVILALPGDSRVRHMNTVCRLIDGGLQQIRNHTLVILDGSELGTDRNRAQFHIKTRYRVIPRGFGIYHFGDRELRSAEIEEVCVENETLSFEDYVECRRFALTTMLFHNDGIFNELYQLLHISGCNISDWLKHLHSEADTFPENLKAVYDAFTEETINELSNTYEELERRIRTEDGMIESYVAGVRGKNVLYENQTRAYQTCLPELTRVAYRAAVAFLKSTGADERIYPGYIAELERYAQARKKDLLELDKSFTAEFKFDFVALETSRFASLPDRQEPTTVEFGYDDWQKEFFTDQLRRYGHDAQAWTKMFSRTPIKKMFRRAQYAQMSATGGGGSGDPVETESRTAANKPAAMTAPRAQMTRSPSRGFRPDIEGLRAIAILLVVGYHAGIPGLSGGFVGVDIFFVLSGYLITRLLVGEIDSSGTIDFGRFYARRARRLLPALTLTVLVTVMAGALIYPPSEVTQGGLATTAMSTAAYVSNLFFVRWGDDYFAPSPEKNPLLHTWSLSVEEQFYLVWPLFVIFALKLLSFSSPRKASQGRLLWWMAAAGVLSFALSLYWTTAQRSWAFYTMPGRAWEFALGGLGVLFPATALRAVRRIPPFWGWAGIAGILLAATTLNKSTSFPGIAVLLPALSTILVLCAGAERENSFLSRILRTQPLQDIGSLSYSWYLWHWPVLTLGLALIPVHSVLVRVALVTLALGLSVLSYRVIENPIRESRKLAGSKRYSFAMVALLALIGISTSFAWRKVSVLKAAEPGQLRFDIAHKDYAVSLLNDKCTTDVFETQVKSCSFGIDNSPNTIVLFGDSHAAQWFPALEPISKTRGFRLVTLVKLGCGAVDAPIYNDRGRFNVECGQWREKALQKIAQMNPALTVVTSSEKYRLTDEQWRNGTDSVVKNLAAASQEVLILRDTPAGDFDIPSCLARRQWRPFFVPASSCQFSFSRTSMIYDFEIAAAARYKNVMTADLSSRICPSGICTGLRGNLVMYRDNDHLTASFARTLERDLDVQIDRALHRTPRILNVAANPL